MTDQPIALASPDPAWQARFHEQAARLGRILAPWLCAPVEHVGSTAIPGLIAKPIVDLLAPVRDLDAARASVPVLEADGWLFWPDDPNRDHRLWFLRPDPAARTHHLQVMRRDHPAAVAVLAFRDALRADPALRDAYAALKEELARTHRDDRNGYTNAKADFVWGVLRARGVALPPRRSL